MDVDRFLEHGSIPHEHKIRQDMDRAFRRQVVPASQGIYGWDLQNPGGLDILKLR